MNSKLSCLTCSAQHNNAFYEALSNDHLECLQKIFKKDFYIDDSALIEIACWFGSLKCLMFLHKNECLISEIAFLNTVKKGHFDCMVYAHSQGCKLTSLAMKYAIQNNEYKCLRYLLENNCPWDELIYDIAIDLNFFPCFEKKYMEDPDYYSLEDLKKAINTKYVNHLQKSKDKKLKMTFLNILYNRKLPFLQFQQIYEMLRPNQ